LFGEPELPDLARRGVAEQRILAFGKWGTYKRLEPLIEAFEKVSAEQKNVRLIIAGANHPETPGYVESVARSVAGHPRIEFTVTFRKSRWHTFPERHAPRSSLFFRGGI